jgi:hypothetical protein
LHSVTDRTHNEAEPPAPRPKKPGADSVAIWLSFTRELATADHVWQRLIVEHAPTPAGQCRACTTPGRGTPCTAWPCSIWSVADAARKLHDGL